MLIGRTAHLEEAGRLLRRARLLTLVGLPGVGKTRFAAAVAHRAGARRGFPDGVHTVGLSALRDPDLVPHTLAHQLGVRDHCEGPVREALLGHLADRRLLLVLDDCEHVVRSCAELAADILAGCPGVRLLATSRIPLGLDGEITMAVPPLTDEEAIVLFARHAVAVSPGFEPHPGHDALVLSLCRRLDRLPLAIELAAGQLDTLTVEQLEEALDLGLDLTGRTGAPTPAHHHSLRTALGRSYELCTPGGRLLWARLSVFCESFTAADAAEVCGDTLLPDPAAELDELALASLVTRRQGTYWLPVTVRTYGMQMLSGLGESGSVHSRHLDWCERKRN